MRFVVDESVEAPIYRRLELAGHGVWSVGAHAAGSSDTEVLNYAQTKDAILLTADKDFGDLVYRGLLQVRGVVLLRLHGLPLTTAVEKAMSAIESVATHLDGSFIVITPEQIRVRPLP